jgi:DNA-binding HxlR family transcriptional regulator
VLRVCAVTDAVALLGDRYSLPLVRELLYGNGRFTELVQLLGAPRTLLSSRLRRLEMAGVVKRRRYQAHPPRDEYFLTDAGRELLPVLVALKEWGDRHCPNPRSAAKLNFAHACGEPLASQTVCRACRKPVRFEDLRVSGKIQPLPRAR